LEYESSIKNTFEIINENKNRDQTWLVYLGDISEIDDDYPIIKILEKDYDELNEYLKSTSVSSLLVLNEDVSLGTEAKEQTGLPVFVKFSQSARSQQQMSHGSYKHEDVIQEADIHTPGWNEDEIVHACTEEAKVCPDGSVVGRVPPSCEFEACPEIRDCAGVGEQFSSVYREKYPEKCCTGLKEWWSGMDTREIKDGKCIETGKVSGNPVGTCLACGDGKCDEIENICNCPEDCGINGGGSSHALECVDIKNADLCDKTHGCRSVWGPSHCEGSVCTTDEVWNGCIPEQVVCEEGCSYQGKCISYGIRTEDRYCDIDDVFRDQKIEGAACQNNYECKTNQCSSGKCIDLANKIEEQQNLIERLFDWLGKLFGGK
jgi:hypothetical protein